MPNWIIPLALLALVVSSRRAGDPQEISEMYSQIRGLRNNNPGNIRHGDAWRGMKAEQGDRAFIQFDSPEWGIRALAKLVLNYQRLHGLDTVRQIVSRWAPPINDEGEEENNTDAYIFAVAASLGVDPDQRLNLGGDQLAGLTKAIIHHENGLQPYSDELIAASLELV